MLIIGTWADSDPWRMTGFYLVMFRTLGIFEPVRNRSRNMFFTSKADSMIAIDRVARQELKRVRSWNMYETPFSHTIVPPD